MNKYIKLILALFVFGVVSCNEWIDPEINVNPNKPADVSEAQLLPAAQGGIAYSAGGEISRYTGFWVQNITGISTHAARHETYGTNEADVENLWKFYTYGGTLMDLHRLIEKAVEGKSPHYSGVGKVLMAYKLGVTTDLWGSIPYSDAFQGDEGNFTATYQTQEQIYTELFKMLDEAIVELGASESRNSPGDEDLMYGGDLKKWTMAAYALKARFSVHLSKVKNGATYADAIAAVAESFKSSADDLTFTFGISANENAPLAQYLDERSGYIGGVGKFMIDLLKNKGDADPRLAVYAKPNDAGEYEGLEPGATKSENKSAIGEWFAKKDATVNLITYAEVKFIEAEAQLQKASPDKAAAAKAYNEGVKASLSKYGVSDADWESRNAVETASTITIEKIMKAKYIATFLQGETFSDWRRYSSIFNLKLAKKAKTDAIPRRLPYPQSEQEYNKANVPQGVKITDRVWWDK